MTALWSTFVDVFKTISVGIVNGCKAAFMEGLYVDPAATELVVSDLALYGMGFLAFGAACYLGKSIFARFKRH